MSEFKLVPGDVVVALFETESKETQWLGSVTEVYMKNPDPGYTIVFKTSGEFLNFVGGIHADIHLTRKDTMWAVVMFPTPDGIITKHYHTYELEQLFKENKLSKVAPEDFFANYLNIILHSR